MAQATVTTLMCDDNADQTIDAKVRDKLLGAYIRLDDTENRLHFLSEVLGVGDNPVALGSYAVRGLGNIIFDMAQDAGTARQDLKEVGDALGLNMNLG